MKRVISVVLLILMSVVFSQLGTRSSATTEVTATSPQARTILPALPKVSSRLEAVAQQDFKEPQTQEDNLNEILFERDLREAFSAIPKLAQEKSAEDGKHGFSQMELKEGQALAAIQTLISKNKGYSVVAQKLYKDCTADNELASTVRALCYFHALELSIELRNSEEIAQLDLPLPIKQLAMKLKN